jgi:uncharacterized membrane protein
MKPEDEPQEPRGFKVEDRRRFSDSGEVRPEHRDAPPQPATPEPSAGAAAEKPAEQAAQTPPPFAMNFSTFVISLSTQALAHLGEIAHPVDKQIAVDLVAAKQLIDILGILKDKTRGNLDASESALLDNMLYDLRIQYVEHARGRA